MKKLKILSVGKLIQMCRFSTQEREGKSPVAWGLAGQAEPSPLVRLKLDFPSPLPAHIPVLPFQPGSLPPLGVNNKTYSQPGTMTVNTWGGHY